ncbi:uncharacterized protein [Watersipora subatra]|uniref:uncharacterized protein n=1 Tax=Watersipora subatra TaxID=2589382 RepID=UPI00355C9BA6
MSKIKDKVLSLDEQTCNGTDHYIDDIWVNEEVVQADVVRAHLLSNLALGVSLEVDGYTVEDAAWLRKEDDGAHINVAELEAALKGINLALKWKMPNLQVITDSATVYGWINSAIEDTKRPMVTGLNEIEDIKKVHQDHHFGVSKALYLAQKKLGRTIKKDIVEQVVKTCLMCNSVDPHPIKWDHGQLNVANFKLANETSDVVIKQLDNVFQECEPPKEFLSDIGPCFTSARIKQFLQKWSVEQILSCAYKPTGNGIIERHRRIIKRAVMRTGKGPEEMAYWYNDLLNSNGIVPVEELYTYRSDLAGATKSTEIPQKLSDNRDRSLSLYKVGFQT